jgi:hypothetical protein
MKKLHFLQVVPSDLMFASELRIQLLNFREIGYSDIAHVLVFTPESRMNLPIHPSFPKLVEDFPEVKFHFYQDTDNVEKAFRRVGYIPLLRPYCLKRYFKENPELTKDAIFYHDSDILFTKYLDFTPFLQDDQNYLSWTGNRAAGYNYICADHFDSKLSNVRENRHLEAAGLLDSFTGYFDISEEEFRARKSEVGGAQYILKNIDASFWEEVYNACLQLVPWMSTMNQVLMRGETPRQREDNGFQSFCMDMWAILFLLWQRGLHTECPEELDFIWATDPIEKWGTTAIFHNAGRAEGLFDKRSYSNNNKTPFQEDLSWVNKGFCSYKYVEQIQKVKQVFNL